MQNAPTAQVRDRRAQVEAEMAEPPICAPCMRLRPTRCGCTSCTASPSARMPPRTSSATPIVARFAKHVTNWRAARPGQAQVIIVDREPPHPYRQAFVKYYSRRADQPPYGLIEDALPSDEEEHDGDRYENDE